MAEVQYRRLVWQRTRQPQTYEPPHRLNLVENVLHTRVAQVVEQLHAVYPKHRRQLIRTTPTARLGILRADALLQLLPWDQTIHPLQKHLTTGLALLDVIIQVGKRRLFHRIHRLSPHSPCCPQCYYASTLDLFRVSLDQPEDTQDERQTDRRDSSARRGVDGPLISLRQHPRQPGPDPVRSDGDCDCLGSSRPDSDCCRSASSRPDGDHCRSASSRPDGDRS